MRGTWPSTERRSCHPTSPYPRDRHFYLGALRALRLIAPDHAPTERLAAVVAASDRRVAFADAFAQSPVGSAWLAWSGTEHLAGLEPASATSFLVACSDVSASTAQRRASTLRKWLAWEHGRPPRQPESPPPPPPSPPPAPRADPHRLLAGLARSGARLQLDTTELCFLAALFLRGDRGALASFEDEVLVDVFEQVCDLASPDADNPRKRATHAIQRLRDDRLLQRVDGAGLVRTGEYTLTGLAAAIVEFYLRDESLTKESLLLLTRALHLTLGEIRTRARAAGPNGDWARDVVGPLSVTIRDLVQGIRRRQRGLDADQEQVQEQIGELLHERWFEAVETCERLLETTSATLRELNEVLLRDTHQFVTVLQEIQGLAVRAGQPSAEEAAQQVVEHVDVIAAWGSARQRAWSEYYQYVHRFLQDVVRLDPDRALSHRLRDLVVGFPQQPFSAHVASTPSIRLLRAVEVPDDRPPVQRPHELRDAALEDVASDDPQGWLEERVFAALQQGARGLSEVTTTVLSELPQERHALYAGRIAALVAAWMYVQRDGDEAWHAVTPELEITEWELDGLREVP